MSNYPEQIDTNKELYEVHDNLRLVLAEDYNPGDTSIIVEDSDFIGLFPQEGIITLTEQFSDNEYKALSFFYSGISGNTIGNLELLPGFIDSFKPKQFTNITQNVMAEHHNAIKDAILAIESFAGIKMYVVKSISENLS